MLKKIKFPVLTLFIFFTVELLSKPFWINNPPVEKNYIYFTGESHAEKYNKKAEKKAVNNAFKTAEIYFEFKLRKSRFELVKSYFDFKDKKIYVLTRYPVYEFFKEKNEKILKEKERERFIRKNIRKALSREEDGRVMESLKILNKLRAYRIKDEGVLSEIKNLEEGIINGINFRIYPYSNLATTSKEYPSKIKIKLYFQDESTPIPDTKLVLGFKKGSGWIEKKEFITDKKGECEFKIKRFNTPGENIITLKISDIPDYLDTPEAEIKFNVTGKRLVLKSKSYLLEKGERKEDYFLFLEKGSPLGTLKIEINSRQAILISFELLSEEAVYEVTERVEVEGIKIEGKETGGIRIEPVENLSVKTWYVKLPPVLAEIILDRYRINKIKHPYRGEIKIFEESRIILNLYYY